MLDVKPPLARRLAAELLGTGLLVTVVVGSGIAAQSLSPDDVGLQLLENSLATVFGLAVLILVLGPVSGAHFNPVVSAVDWLLGRRAGTGLSGREVAAYTLAQVTGGVLGAVLANVMFDLPAGQVGPGRPVRRSGRRLHRGGVLVHQLDVVRQPGRHRRTDVLRHLRRHRPRLGPPVRPRPGRRRRRGLRARPAAVSQ